jgi:uncharacterized cupredoxin-like copper-binding protein
VTFSPSAAAPSTASQPSAAAPVASAAVASAAAVSSGPETIKLSEWKVVVASDIKAGKTKYTITNSGTTPHELLMFKSKLDPASYPVDKAGDIIEDGVGVVLSSDGENIDPAGTQTRSVTLAPGKYVFVCNIAGHFKSGMFQIVTVSA